MQMKKIGVLVGSLRRDSYSKAIAKVVSDMLSKNFHVEMLKIGDLPLYNQDYDDDETPPEAYTLFREKIKNLDAFLFVTPEYNRSYSAVLKNALDIASRPYGQNLWDGKPGAIISVSPGRLSAFGANHHLRQVMVFLNIFMMQQPEAYIGNVDTIFNEDGTIKDENRKASLANIADAFSDWVNLFESRYLK